MARPKRGSTVRFDVSVTSTSRSAGNKVVFTVDGQNLTVATGRGMNVAVVSPMGVLETFQVFDTHAAGSQAGCGCMFGVS